MNLTTELEKLPGLYSQDGARGDLPAVYVFTPDANATWILWEYDPEDGTAYGMCDLGLGYPECGTVTAAELESARGVFGLPVEVDKTITTRFAGMRNASIDIPEWMEK